ncbi:hypothetical protein PoB_006320900 [Plakobranchus ocellatus]|uniref:Uncharacterized protein n=1 Tax=Plakobranchus ocellatus TaxID=259542 RepID=A0AAV4CXQ8_9GAST|nr:hypothetical protein PoB_006320900 [Plakobranchus ocellatus]
MSKSNHSWSSFIAGVCMCPVNKSICCVICQYYKKLILHEVHSLPWCGGLCAPFTQRAMLAGIELTSLVGSPMLDRSKGRGQTKHGPDWLVLKELYDQQKLNPIERVINVCHCVENSRQ